MNSFEVHIYPSSRAMLLIISVHNYHVLHHTHGGAKIVLCMCITYCTCIRNNKNNNRVTETIMQAAACEEIREEDV